MWHIAKVMLNEKWDTLWSIYFSLTARALAPILSCRLWSVTTHSFSSDGFKPVYFCRAKFCKKSSIENTTAKLKISETESFGHDTAKWQWNSNSTYHMRGIISFMRGCLTHGWKLGFIINLERKMAEAAMVDGMNRTQWKSSKLSSAI